jgi:hypothetical protein
VKVPRDDTDAELSALALVAFMPPLSRCLTIVAPPGTFSLMKQDIASDQLAKWSER